MIIEYAPYPPPLLGVDHITARTDYRGLAKMPTQQHCPKVEQQQQQQQQQTQIVKGQHEPIELLISTRLLRCFFATLSEDCCLYENQRSK